jgi:outer membrane protein assembly factor BamD
VTLLAGVLALAGCGAKKKPPMLNAEPGSQAAGATAAGIDSLWAVAEKRFRMGSWAEAGEALERVNLEMLPTDPRRTRMHFLLAESLFQQGDYIQAAREFRHVSDDTPGDPLAPDALLRAGDSFAALWRRPELDPTYGQTAMSTYTEVTTRFPGTSAYDSAILYYRDVVATYPRTQAAPKALADLVKAYYKMGYYEDVKETCGYIRRFHPNLKGMDDLCPVDAPSS